MSCVEYKGKAYTREQFAKLLVDGELSNLIGDLKPVIKLEPKIDESDKLKTLVDKARTSLSKILPNVKIILHNTEDEYKKAVGESLSSGAFMNDNIHINPVKANSRTVAHEVFHAILLGIVKSDPAAQRVTAAMISAIEKVLPPDMKVKLQDFVENGYDDQKQLWDEEKLAELVGYLADNYPKLTLPAQNIIKTWLDKLAKLVGLKEFTDKEVIDFMNTISGKIASGEEITSQDVNMLGASGKISVKSLIGRKSIIGDVNLKRFPVNKNTSIKENVPLSDFNGKTTNIIESDRMTGAYISDENGNPLFKFFGGIYYPVITGKWWASRDKSTANKIVKNNNKNRDEDGYVYTSPIILGDLSHMSNQDMFEAVWEFMKHDLNSKNNKVTKQQFHKLVDSAFSVKKIINKKSLINISPSDSIKAMLDKLDSVMTGSDFTFDERKAFINSILGNPKVKSDRNFPSAGSIAEVADKFTEPETKKAGVHDIVMVMRTKGELSLHESDPSDEFYHKSYPVEIVSSEPIEVFMLDGAYPLGESVPELTKSNGEKFTWKEYYEKHSKVSDKYANAQYGRTAKLSSASGVIESNKVSDRKQNSIESDSMFETKSSNGTPIRFQRTQPKVKKMYEDSNKAIRDMEKTRGVKEFFNDVYKRVFDRQKNIKDLITSFGNKSSIKAYNRLVTKTGASGFASLEFKEASKKIYDKLNKTQLETLDQLIYARRIKAINEARIKDGRPLYKGKDGYSLNEANEDLKIIKDQIGDKEFNNLNDRATEYFYQYKKSLRDLYDSGRIDKETYNRFKNDEYSPIRTIKYVLSPNTSTEEIDMEAKRFGMAKKDIMKLSDENANDVIMDSKWLLAMTINANKSRAFENKMLDEFNKAFENLSEDEKKSISEHIVENPVIGKKQDGGLKYKYDSVTLPDGFVKVSFFENGNKKDIIINKKYADQLLDVKNKHIALEWIGAISGGQVLRFFATGGNPLFVIGNIANDFQNILLNTNVYSEFLPLASIQIARDFVKNFVKKAVLNDTYNKSYKDYVSHGGALDMMSRDGLKALESINIPSKMVSGTKKGLLAYGHFISFLGDTSEVAFRLAVFDKYKEKLVKEFEKQNGRTPNNEELDDIMWDAARESRETMPFDQGGDLTKAANIVMPYLNAQMQALRKTLVFAAKNPKRMAKNVLQYTLMSSTLSAASFAMLLRGLGDDDDDDKKKLSNMIDAWKSISDYEKANYHIIFTGNKDKDGEFEYYRVKKLPIFSILSTAAEELILKTFLASKGVDYEISGDAVKESVIKSIPLPIDVQEWLGKNPAAGALISYWANKDTFTGEEIFRQPRGKKILPEAEINNKTNELYKDLGSATGLSPARSKVAIEKIITSETTNPTIPLMYSAYDGLFHKKDGLGKEVSDAMSAVGDAFGRKLVRYTDKNVLRYKKQDEIEYKESVIETEIWKKEQEMYDEIKDVYDSGKKLNGEQFKEMLTSKFEPKDIAKYAKKYKAYINNRGADREVLDIIFEDVPEVQAMKLNERYGNSFEGDEIKELMSTASRSGRKISNQAMSIYYDKYVKRKATN